MDARTSLAITIALFAVAVMAGPVVHYVENLHNAVAGHGALHGEAAAAAAVHAHPEE